MLESGETARVGDVINSYFTDTTQSGQSNNDLCMVILPVPHRFLGKGSFISSKSVSESERELFSLIFVAAHLNLNLDYLWNKNAFQ